MINSLKEVKSISGDINIYMFMGIKILVGPSDPEELEITQSELLEIFNIIGLDYNKYESMENIVVLGEDTKIPRNYYHELFDEILKDRSSEFFKWFHHFEYAENEFVMIGVRLDSFSKLENLKLLDKDELEIYQKIEKIGISNNKDTGIHFNVNEYIGF